jgi:hypothetical protein
MVYILVLLLGKTENRKHGLQHLSMRSIYTSIGGVILSLFHGVKDDVGGGGGDIDFLRVYCGEKTMVFQLFKD